MTDHSFQPPTQDELNSVLERRYSVGFACCDCCNTRLLKTKLTYIAGWQLCGTCYTLYQTDKIELDGR